MAIITVSPGVFTQENDLSFVPQGIAQIGGAIVGLTEKGPAFSPTKVINFNGFRTTFGNLSPSYYVPYTAKNYLQNSDNVTICRVLGTTTPLPVGDAIVISFPTATVGGAVAAAALSASNTAMAVVRMRSVAVTTASVCGVSNNFILGVNGSSAFALSMNKTDENYIGRVLGTDPFAPRSGDLLTSVYVESIFDYAYFASGPVSGADTAAVILGSGDALGGYKNARTPVIISQSYSGAVYDLFHFETLSDGDKSTYDVKISISMETSQITVSAYPVFTVAVRDYNDTDDRQVVLETFTGTLDPTANNYIKRVIGDRYKSFNTSVDPPETMYDGEFENNSKYVRVVMYDGYPRDAKPSGFKAIPCMTTSNATKQVNFKNPYKFNHLNFAGVKDSKIHMGFDSGLVGAGERLGYLVTSITANSTTGTKGFLISTLTAENSGTATLVNTYELVNATTASPLSATIYYNYLKFTVPTYGGWDGIDERKDKLQLLADGTLSADFYKAIQVLGNPDELDFNLLTVPGLFAGGPASQGNIPSKALDMVQTRGDAFYIMDIADSTFATTTASVLSATVNGVATVAQTFDSNYVACYYPSLRILDTDNNKFVWVPASVAVMGAYAFNDKVGQPWFAPAGLNRGVLNVFEARKRLTQTQRDTLYLGKVNPIATFPGQGIVIWGQKTLQAKASALDRVNVRRLLLTARKLISSTAKYFVFEPNNGLTRSNLVNAINPILENIQKNQGIEVFKVVCDDSNNTPDTIDRNILVGDIYIQPTRTAEMFIFNFNITRSGVNFAE